MSNPRELLVTNHDACDRFFSIAELLRTFLDECSPQVLLNCTMVCSSWNDIISESDLLQEHLFLKPAESRDGVRRRLNPMLQSHFAPILCPDLHGEMYASKELDHGIQCTYMDIIQLPWAQDSSIDLNAPKRRAFARSQASWRNMLVSQPPLTRVDWWHEWLFDPNVTDEDAEWAARRGFSEDEVEVDGWGHQDRTQNFVTLGLLWDLVEGRLARNCLARVHYFLEGKAVEDDAFATNAERDFAAREDSQRPFTQSTPRVKISTQQIWNKVPWSDAGFDMAAQRWISMPQKRKHTFGDGFNALRSDCYEEGRQLWPLALGEIKSLRKRQAQYRFSQSEGCCYFELDGESSGFMIRDDPSLVLH